MELLVIHQVSVIKKTKGYKMSDEENLDTTNETDEINDTPSKPAKIPSISGYIQVQHEMYTGGSGGYTFTDANLSAGNHTITVGEGSSSGSNIICSDGGNSSIDDIIAYGGGGAKALNNTHGVGVGGSGTQSNGNSGTYNSVTYSSNDKYNGSFSGGASVYNGYGAGGSITVTSSATSYTSGGNGYVKITVK